MFYGSPSEVAAKPQQTSQDSFAHPLMVKENWKIQAGRQRVHNNNILTLINTANVNMLTVRRGH